MLKKIVWNYLLPLVLASLLFLYIKTLRVQELRSNFIPCKRDRKRNYLYTHFHEDIPVVALFHSYTNVCTMASKSKDGELISRVLTLLGFKMIRGSTRHFGKELVSNIETQVKRGKDLAFAVDGPKGPRRKVKKGASFIASRIKIPVIPTVADSKYKFVFKKSWDQMSFPYPFSKTIIMYGDPIEFDHWNTKNLDQIDSTLESTLLDLKQKAHQYFLDRKYFPE